MEWCITFTLLGAAHDCELSAELGYVAWLAGTGVQACMYRFEVSEYPRCELGSASPNPRAGTLLISC